MSEQEPSITENLTKFYTAQLESGYKITDKNSFNTLRKMGQAQFELPVGWNGKAKKILQQVLEEKKIAVSGMEQEVSGMKVSLKKEEIPEELPPPQPEQAPQETPQGQETLQTQQTEQKKELPPLTEDDKKRYTRIFGRVERFVTKYYVKWGILEADEGWNKDVNELGTDWASFCFDNNVRLPKTLEFTILMGSTVIVIFAPLVRWLFFRKKKEKKEEKKAESTKST